MIRPTTMARKTTPPMTPPAMGPAFDLLLLTVEVEVEAEVEAEVEVAATAVDSGLSPDVQDQSNADLEMASQRTCKLSQSGIKTVGDLIITYSTKNSWKVWNVITVTFR